MRCIHENLYNHQMHGFYISLPSNEQISSPANTEWLNLETMHFGGRYFNS